MGGMHGFGAVTPEPDDAPHHGSIWEARVHAMMNLAIGHGLFTIDAARFGVEQMNPERYLNTSYFARWLVSLEWNLTAQGYLSNDELDARTALILKGGELPVVHAPPARGVSGPPQVVAPAPRYHAGEWVRTRNVNPAGHTRLPRYARGKRGVVTRVQPPEILPDANAHGPGAPLEPTYEVRFESRELWGDAAEPSLLTLNLWESYLLSGQ